MKQITFMLDNEKQEFRISIDEKDGLWITLKDSEFSNTDNYCSVKLTSFEGERIADILQSMSWDEGINETVRSQELIIRETPKNICGSCESCSCVCNNLKERKQNENLIELICDVFDYMTDQPQDNLVDNLINRLRDVKNEL